MLISDKTPSKGLCRACGKLSSLPIHQECGKILGGGRKGPKHLKPYTEKQISFILKGAS